MDSYRLDQVDAIPEAPGLYAWYHELAIPMADVRGYQASLDAAVGRAAQREVVSAFVQHMVFAQYTDSDYQVELKGPLKARYRGPVPQVQDLASSFVDGLIETPDSLVRLAQVLRSMTPYFASPIYIGVAKASLRHRISTHRRLIDEYRTHAGVRPDLASMDADHSFAFDAVVTRRFRPTDLRVFVMVLGEASPIAVSAEHVLNRINFPLCGRN